MEKLYLVRPTLDYKEQGIEYIKENIEYCSNIHGVGGLDRYIENYEGWLEKLEKERNIIPNENKVPAETYYLVRKDDNKVIGMISIRLCLNEKLKQFGGNIGYGIRPTERKKGYNKVNLYLALLKCKEHNIKEVQLDCDKYNLGSKKTIESLGGVLKREHYSEEYNCYVLSYIINVSKSLVQYENIYKDKIYTK